MSWAFRNGRAVRSRGMRPGQGAVASVAAVLAGLIGGTLSLSAQPPTAALPDAPGIPGTTGGEAPPATTPLAEEVPPEPRTEYLGRTIAQTMHWTGAEWLVRDNREKEERCSLMLANLGVRPGMTICDLGSGNGFHTLKLARMVGETGKIYAVDIQEEMLAMLRERAGRAKLDNVVPTLGLPHDPRLPAGTMDLVLMVDVYHELSYPEQVLTRIRESLAPGGKLVLVEFRAEDPRVPIKPLHKMSKEQIDKEMTANGFKLASSFDRLPWQHLVFYEVAETTPAATGGPRTPADARTSAPSSAPGAAVPPAGTSESAVVP